MESEVEIEALTPTSVLLLAGVMLDLAGGDPRFGFHPVRMLGRTLSVYERFLRAVQADQYVGGCLLFLLLTATGVVLPCLIVIFVSGWSDNLGLGLHAITLYFCIAFRDLFDHVRAVQLAAGRNDLAEARMAIESLVGRDTRKMDLSACRRAAIESLSESFVDGFLSPLVWYIVLGLPGILLFKVVSTMDSMVGYKTPDYVRFGWCGARLDDLMNYVPSRISWLLLVVSGAMIRGLSARNGLKIGLEQHTVVPGPNPGWSEATMAGLLGKRLIGPVWKDGILITEAWLGDSAVPEGGTDHDLNLAMWAVFAAAFLSVLICLLLIP